MNAAPRANADLDKGYFNCFAIDMRPSGNAMHVHDCCEFYLCAAGDGTMCSDAVSYSMKRDDFFFFRHDIGHVCRPGLRGCQGLVLNVEKKGFASTLPGDRVSGQILEHLEFITGNKNNRISLSSPGIAKVGTLFRDMIREYWNKAPGYETAVKIRIQEMLLDILRDEKMASSFQPVFNPVRNEERLRDVLAFLRIHFMDDISVVQIAEMACMSRSHFHAIFKKSTGRTLMRHVIELRTEAAAKMLSSTDVPISQIAFECGFPCASHFYHSFRSIVGMTPREFRLQAVQPQAFA